LTGVAGRKDISLMTITFDLSQRKTTLLWARMSFELLLESMKTMDSHLELKHCVL
jgi:hypothetical protein